MPVTRYVSANGRLRGEITSGNRTDYLTDALGSVTATVNSSAAVVNTYRFKPYGQQLAKTGSGTDPRYLWTGDTGSRRTNLNRAEQYNVYRHYGSQQAAWTTVEPFWPQLPDAYSYCQLNPVSFYDATGLQPSKLRKRHPCDKFMSRKPVYTAPWDSGCGKLNVPPGLKWPPKRDDIEAFECWLSILEGKVPKLCIPGLSADFAYYQLGNWLGSSDKYAHCVLGCLAREFLGSCCALFLSLWLEVKPYPPGNHDPDDVLATLEGSKCAESSDPWIPHFCKYLPIGNEAHDWSTHIMCEDCCSAKAMKGALGR